MEVAIVYNYRNLININTNICNRNICYNNNEINSCMGMSSCNSEKCCESCYPNSCCNCQCNLYPCCCPVCPPLPPPPIPPIPPVPPLPPVPPVPPGPFTGDAQFQSLRNMPIRDGQDYLFNTVILRGNAINHVDGTSQIILAPNTEYVFAWRTDTISNVIPDVTVGASLIVNGMQVPGGTDITRGPSGLDLTTQGAGVFVTTGAQPVTVTLRFISSSGELDGSSAVLRIMTA